MRLPHSSRGNVLTWFAVLLFVLMPLAALVIDFGLVLLTRRQMQTAVNLAALEGLRFQDDGALTEEDRRARVLAIMTAVFDDDLGATNTDASNYGAGPTVDFQGGVQLDGTEFRSSRLITGDSLGVFKPQNGLQLNLDNHIYGDMAAGQWRDTDDHREGPIDLSPADPELDDPYERKDFKTEQSEDVDPTVDYDPDLRNDAFLVRLRRTRSEFDGIPPFDEVAGSSSTGPSLPSVFGRGGITRAEPPDDAGEIWTRRERGTMVRATAMARMQAALTVGLPSTELNVGLARFAMGRSDWENTPLDVALQVSSMGNTVSGGLTGRGISQDVTAVGSIAEDALVLPWRDGVRYVPIYDNLSERIVGFGMIEITNSLPLDMPPSATVRKLPPESVATRNASAMLLVQTIDNPTPSEWMAILTAAHELADTTNGNPLNHAPVLAPALQRALP